MRFFRSPPPRITLAQPAEAALLAELYERAWAGCEREVDSRFLEEQRASAEEVRVWLEGGFEVYRIGQDERLVAALRCSFPTSTCHLDRLAVDPDLRRRGFGRALVEHAVDRARRAGVTRVWAEVSPRLSETVALFAQVGFREAGRHQASYHGEPLLLLELPI